NYREVGCSQSRPSETRRYRAQISAYSRSRVSAFHRSYRGHTPCLSRRLALPTIEHQFHPLSPSRVPLLQDLASPTRLDCRILAMPAWPQREFHSLAEHRKDLT